MNKETTKQEFVNPEVEQILQPLIANATSFTSRRKGAQLKAIIWTLSEVFQEDRYKIRKIFSPDTQAEKQEHKPPKVSKNLNGPQIEPCDGCPGSAGFITNQERKMVAEKKAPASTKKEKTIDLSKPFTSIEDIVDRFQGNPNAMLAFCNHQDIDIPAQVKAAKTIAKYMLKHYQNDEQ